jgi:hypothetical protein
MPVATGLNQRKRNRLAALALCVGVILIAVFGLRTWHQIEFSQRVQRGEVRVETLKGWMTLPYIAQTYKVPEVELRSALGVPASGHEERSLRQWFDAARIDAMVGREALEKLILARQTPPGVAPK